MKWAEQWLHFVQQTQHISIGPAIFSGTSGFTKWSTKSINTLYPTLFQVKVDCGEQWLHLVEQTNLSQLAQQVLVVLLEAPDGQLSLNNFPASYYHIWEQWLVPTEYGYSKMVLLLKTLHHVVVVSIDMSVTFYLFCILLDCNRYK